MRLNGGIVAIGAAGAMLASCVTPQTQYSAAAPGVVATEAQKQKELFIQELLRDQARLASVAAPLVAANVELCKDKVVGSLGFDWWSLGDLPKDYRDAAAATFNLASIPQVSSVQPGGPGERAGVHPGDQIVSINGRDVPLGDSASGEQRDRVREQMKAGSAMPAVDLVLRRNGLRVQAQVQPALVCDFTVVVEASDKVNAYADGNAMKVTRGMLRFVENDQELAVVLSHELAHNAMGHISAKQTNAVMAGAGGLVIDILIAAAASIPAAPSPKRP